MSAKRKSVSKGRKTGTQQLDVKASSKIRYRDSDQKRVSKAVQQFNSKLTRESKKNPDIIPYLPKRINVKEISKALKQGSRKEFNRQVTRLEKFVKNKNSTNLTKIMDSVATKWEVNNIRADVQIINARRKKELKRISPSPEKGNLKTVKNRNLQPKKMENLESMNWKRFKQSVEKQVAEDYALEGWKIYKENYMDTLRWNLGYNGAYLAGLVDSIPIDIFSQMFEAEEPFLMFDQLYAPLAVEMITNQIISALKSYGLNTDSVDFLYSPIGGEDEIYS